MIRIQQLKLTLHEDPSVLKQKILHYLHIHEDELLSYQIYKESIDARKKDQIVFSYIVDCEVKNEKRILKRKDTNLIQTPQLKYQMPPHGTLVQKHRPVVVGFGPAGMFAALLLAQDKQKPIVFERGECVDERVKSVEQFWNEGILNSNSNVQFGEGGAGTFSDGKLTTRVKDLRSRKVLEELVRFGAPKEILYEAHPHIGTDLLREIVKNLRKEIIRLGGEIHFNSKMEKLICDCHAIKGLIVNGKEIVCDDIILAIGHSARDTFETLCEQGIQMEAKPFAIGARIEHKQEMIDFAQFGNNAHHPRLKKASYRLVHTASNQRGVYTFCMCPGGMVVPSTSKEGQVVVNGMSEHARDKENANSAILVQVSPNDFGTHPLDGMKFQERLEQKAYQMGKEGYRAPAQLVKDFLANRPSTQLGTITPSYARGVTLCNLHDLFPTEVAKAMQEGIAAFDRKLKGFACDDAVLTAIETRSSSPLRINRDRDLHVSLNTKGLYPCGEGAGYAGGIVSAAIDGLLCAESIIQKYRKVDK